MTRKNVPRGPDDLMCRWHKKPMSKVCHTCDCWTHVYGRNPNTGETIDDWKCSDAWVPILLMEIAQKINQQGAAIESFRNETAQANVAALHVALGMTEKPKIDQIQLQQNDTQLIEKREETDT